jgi:hypothetical protein
VWKQELLSRKQIQIFEGDLTIKDPYAFPNPALAIKQKLTYGEENELLQLLQTDK